MTDRSSSPSWDRACLDVFVVHIHGMFERDNLRRVFFCVPGKLAHNHCVLENARLLPKTHSQYKLVVAARFMICPLRSSRRDGCRMSIMILKERNKENIKANLTHSCRVWSRTAMWQTRRRLQVALRKESKHESWRSSSAEWRCACIRHNATPPMQWRWWRFVWKNALLGVFCCFLLAVLCFHCPPCSDDYLHPFCAQFCV